MISYARKVGRLVEVRYVGRPDTINLGRLIALANEVGPDAKVVIIGDMRAADTMTSNQLEALSTAILASSQRWQMGVAIDRERPPLVGNPQRARDRAGKAGIHAVHTVDDALSLLSSVLNAAELARAREFFDEGAA